MDKDQSNAWLPPGDGWIEWRGGENPAPGAEVFYLCRGERKRQGYLEEVAPSDECDWGHNIGWSDIVAYRVATPAPTAASRDEVFAELAVMLTEVRDAGLIYWEPQTERGYQNKSAMIARVDAVLQKAADVV